ncbi:hypothetical protein CJF31_00002475 [Rutstroemia sp. NJR-2017a BVV2]|nr:hypothetical protein CJF31_00002475 [Rutstroemia sp. NJR-2017a BVV2]
MQMEPSSSQHMALLPPSLVHWAMRAGWQLATH